MVRLRWKESKDVYQPTRKNLREFIQEKQQRILEYSNIDLLYRQISHEPMTVFVERQAESQLIQHLSIDRSTETGGVVVGEAYFCPETRKHYTEIVGSIAATHTVGNAVHFQFTPECWSSIFRNQKQYYPGSTIVGWYHSHPGHGIFLSGTDLNTQRLSFNKIWQIAVVFDPQRREIGYFYSANGIRIEPIYLGNSSSSEQLKWRDNSQQAQPREEQQQPEVREVTLPPVPPSQPVQNGAILLEETPARRGINRQNGDNQGDNRILIILMIIVIIFLSGSLFSLALQFNPPNTPQPKSQPVRQLPDPPEEIQPLETQPIESQTREYPESEEQQREFQQPETKQRENPESEPPKSESP